MNVGVNLSFGLPIQSHNNRFPRTVPVFGGLFPAGAVTRTVQFLTVCYKQTTKRNNILRGKKDTS